jgi:hypothetical protein
MSPADLPVPPRPSRPAPPAPLPQRAAIPRPAALAAVAPPAPPALPTVSSAPTDALGRFLAGSTGWHVVPAPVSWPVTVVAWCVLVLDVAVALGLAAGTELPGFLAAISTLGGHGRLLAGGAAVAALWMAVVAVATRGFRRTNSSWLRCWTFGLVVSALALAPVVAAAVAGLLVVALVVAGVLLVAALMLMILAGAL